MNKNKLFEKVITENQGIMFSIAFSILDDRHESLDVMQECMTKAWLQPDFLSEGFNRKAWLVKVVRNMALNLKNSFSRKIVRMFGLDVLSTKAGSSDTAAEAISRQLCIEVRESLAGLDDIDRQIIALRFSADYSYKEIAIEMDIKPGTVMSRLSRIKSRLRESMRKVTGND